MSRYGKLLYITFCLHQDKVKILTPSVLFCHLSSSSSLVIYNFLRNNESLKKNYQEIPPFNPLISSISIFSLFPARSQKLNLSETMSKMGNLSRDLYGRAGHLQWILRRTRNQRWSRVSPTSPTIIRHQTLQEIGPFIIPWDKQNLQSSGNSRNPDLIVFLSRATGM